MTPSGMPFIRVALCLAVPLLLLPSCGEPAAPTGVAGHLPEWSPESGLGFAEPKQVFSENGVLNVTLRMHKKVIEVAGSQIHARPYNDRLIGPTLHVSPGDTIEVNLHNDMNQITNIHYHGLHVSPNGKSDNVFRTIGGHTRTTSTVQLPEDHNPGLYWYHAHWHGTTDVQVTGGLSGLLIVDGLEDLLPAPLQDITQRQFALRDLQHHGDRAAMSEKTMDPTKPTTRLVNGELNPVVDLRPGETQLWRIANVGADQFYRMQLEGHSFHVIAEDAFPVWEVWETDTLLIPPGKRYEVLVQGGAPGTYAFKTIDYDQGFQQMPEVEMATVQVGGTPEVPAELPTGLVAPEGAALDDATIAEERTFTFSIDGAADRFEINGKIFGHHRIDAEPKLGTVEEWTLINDSTEDHPFHIHVNDFQVMSVGGEPYNARGLQDVVLLPKGETVVIRNPFLDYPGKFVFHCHILYHEDHGMMQTVKVVR